MAKKKIAKKVSTPLITRPGRILVEKPPHNGKWLKAQLLLAGITQREVAKELGADFSTVSHLFSGRRPMREEDVRVIAGMLKMSVDAFLGKLRSVTPPGVPEGLARQVDAGELAITGWVDGKLVVHDGKPKGPGEAPALPEGGPVRVVRCQTQGSVFDGIDGALVYFRELSAVAAESVGRLCVVGVKGGETLLRVVKRGYATGKYNLSLLNGVVAEEDATLYSASPVIWLKM